nr:hypothetical protein [Tanacetum cinerariifolium]
GDVTRLQALVDKKKIVISEEVVREILQLNDAEGVICLPNEEIFAGLARMGYEKPFTKLTFYKATNIADLSKHTNRYIFSVLSQKVFANMRRVGKDFSGVETPLFESMLSVMDVAEEEEAQVPAQGDEVQEPAAEEVANDVVPPTPTSPSPSSPIIQYSPPYQSPCPPQPQDAEGSSHLFQQVLDTCSALVLRVEDDVENVFNQGRNIVDMDQDEGIKLVVDQEKDAEVLSMQEDDTEVQEAVEVVTTAKLITEVVTAAATQVVAASTPILAAKPKTLTITAAPDVSTKRRKAVVIRDPEEELHSDTPAETPTVKDKGKEILIEAPKPMKKKDQVEMDAKYAKKLHEELDKEREESYKNIDWNASLDHVQSKEPQYIKRYHGIKKKPQTESEARKNMISYLKNTEGFKIEFFKGKTYEEILLIFQARFDANMKFLFKSREEMEKEDEEIIKNINETPTQKVAKRRKLSEEAQEADDLKKRLEIFWNTAMVKRSGDVTRLQALVDKKRIVITEEVVREILQLNDAEGQRFNFSKYIFESLVRNVDSSSKFYMYPRFIQLIIPTNIADLSKHTNRYISPVLTQKVPARGDDVHEHATEEVATDVVPPTPTLLSPSSLVIPSSPPHQSPCPPQLQDAEAAQQLEIVKLKARVKKLEKINKVKSSKLRRLKKVRTSQRVESLDDVENVFNQGRNIVDMDQDEGIELVVDQEKDAEVVAASTPIPAAKPKTPTITVAPDVLIRRRKGVVIRAPEEELHTDTPAETPTVKDKGKGILIEAPKPMKKKDQVEMDAEYAKKLQEELDKEHEEAYTNIDWNAALDHVQSKESQYIKRYNGIKKKPQTESEARKNMISYLKNTEGYKMEFFKGKTYDEILPIFQARFDANLKFLFKSRKEMEKEDEEIIKSINETPAQKAAKRRKLSEEAQEADDLKNRLEIVQDEDDDVFVEATPLAQKVPVIDYQIVVIDNKPKYKIIRADDTHQFYISFTTLLKNFDREDLETLWRIVSDRFSTSKPTNFSDEYLLLTLKTMFGKLDGHDAIWRNQKSVHGLALVKRWKLLTSCGVHAIIL